MKEEIDAYAAEYERLNGVPPTHVIIGNGEPVPFVPRPTEDEVAFIVRVRSAEPPPNWADQIEKKLRRECGFMFGPERYTVERLENK
jgi:hypothetical protein